MAAPSARGWSVPGVPGAVATGLAALLHEAGLLRPVDRRGRTDEERNPALAGWSFADALLHAASGDPLRDDAFGATYPGRALGPPLPATKLPMSPVVLPLAGPVGGSAESLVDVLARRRSVRRYAGPPLSVAQLGAFLWHAARVTGRFDGMPYEATMRPSPSGGACHPLEVYVVVARCEGLARGLYHYDPSAHALERLAGGEGAVPMLGPPRIPRAWGRRQVGILLAARFGRTNWKYRGIAYATVLKDAGALLQTMYLVATALGLAPCAVGAGEGDLFARVTGLDPMDEGLVGELLLGGAGR